ncbi:hypothetical protein Dda_5798 [Drechslerella dactyloides]|uniref:Uncharacterized protein n=1 Tax=Drechslerella dactyloides TaxID=74499 RepID=A0AAD6IUG0_DREDA|nr:hypothetical protein Dda_5798 [Drechslerella dactyloides]
MAPKYTNKLQGKRVLVLGGTSGIGFCVAEAAIEHGAIVTIASSRQTSIDKAIQRIKDSYPDAASRINGTTCNLAGDDLEDQIKALYEFATNSGADKLDHVVNTAGDAFGLPKISEVTIETLGQLSRVRLFGSIMLAKYAASNMNSSAESSFTTTSGVNGAKPGEGWAAVTGFVTAQEGLIRGLAKDLKPIRANNVSPGAVHTELFNNFGNEEQVKAMVETFAGQTLTKRIGKPEDLAETYIYIMKNPFLTGTIQQVEGGYLLV